MKLRGIRLQDFRNIASATLEFDGARIFLLGGNAQGKTNLLEAIGYVSALRAFRPGDNRTLIREGAAEAGLAYHLEHERLGGSGVLVRIRPKGKEAELDGVGVRRLGDFIGRFPTVLFASEDIQLLRGAPSVRRRWLDLHLASLEPRYLDVLQAFHRALDQRNRLLKEGARESELAAFESVLAPAACDLAAHRRVGAARLAQLVREFYGALAGDRETATVELETEPALTAPAEYLPLLEKQRERDRQQRATQRGPHRDDLRLQLDGRVAALFASEGQQRALALAMRFAQVRDIRAQTATAPVVLADDVLGELDPERRERFWAALDADLQVFATGTAPPAAAPNAPWDVWHVSGGAFTRG